MTGTIVVEAAGGGATVTPAPTDTAPAADTARGDRTALVLALLGVGMLVGTFVANRRFAHARATPPRLGDDD